MMLAMYITLRSEMVECDWCDKTCHGKTYYFDECDDLSFCSERCAEKYDSKREREKSDAARDWRVNQKIAERKESRE